MVVDWPHLSSLKEGGAERAPPWPAPNWRSPLQAWSLPLPASGEEERGREEVMSHCHDLHGSGYPAASLAFFIFRLHRVGSSTCSPASSNRNEQRAWTHAVSKPGSVPQPPLNHHHKVYSHGPVQALPTPRRIQGDKKVLPKREMAVLISHPSGHTTSWVNWGQSLPLPETQFAPLF